MPATRRSTASRSSRPPDLAFLTVIHMTHATHEQTINTAFAEVIEGLGRTWTIRAEQIGGVFEGGGRPDILIEKADGWPIVVEAEVGAHRQAEKDAKQRLGRRIRDTGTEVHASLALVYPYALRTQRGAALRNEIAVVQFEYALYTVAANQSISRFPATGWLSGNLAQLALLIHRSSIPAWRVEALADALERGVRRAAGTLSLQHAPGSPLGHHIATILGQSDDSAGQTRRMAMTIIVDALIFHDSLAAADILLPTSPDRPLRSPVHFRFQGSFLPSPLCDEWSHILRVNYWPIFHTAGEILRSLHAALAASLLDILWETAEAMIAAGVATSHDLTGAVFQRLIADRKFLATFYTRPAAAALLSSLALPIERAPNDGNWAENSSLTSLRIGDFACGTGTLLSTAYQRVGLLHEIHGGDPSSLHPRMMEQGIVGLDVLTSAVHLTAAMLAGTHPSTPFEGECLLTMPYGSHDWGVCAGSLDLLPAQIQIETIEAAARTAGGRGPEEVTNLADRVGHGRFHLVIMNPPFTRHGAREGDRTSVHNPAFAAFGADEVEQDAIAKHVRQRLAAGGAGHGHAGLASYFVDLAHKKAANGGTIALVLPLTSLSGQSWEKIRQLLASRYSRQMVVTIAQGGTHTRSFSADTGMAECLVVATKSSRAIVSDRRASFVVLNERPQDTIEGEQIGDSIWRRIGEGQVRRLEDGPFGGSRVVIGDSTYGEVLNCPLPAAGAWQIAGIRDLTLAQTAHQLASGRLWIEGMPPSPTVQVPITTMSCVISRMGPHHLDLTGAQVKADGLPQGPFQRLSGCPVGAAYPCLWSHDSRLERRMVVEPDSHCRMRVVGMSLREALSERAGARWETAGNLHYNTDLQFNSQSIIVGRTDVPSLGGRAWPTILMSREEQEYSLALWCNSTLGLLCHWWMSNKAQAGRGTSTVTSVPTFFVLDVRRLSEHQHNRARAGFERLRGHRFLPFDQVDEDENRSLLDRILIEDVLDLGSGLCDAGGAMELLRSKVAREPQIRGGKKSRIVFTSEGERKVDR